MSAAPGRRVDASMTLLTEMMERPLDRGYAAEADRREAAGLPRSTSARSPVLFLSLVLLGALFTLGATTLNADRAALTGTRTALVAQIESARALAEQRARTVTQLQAQISAAESSAGSDTSGRLATLETQVGALAVHGPAYLLTVDDAPAQANAGGGVDPRAGAQTAGGKVLSKDLQYLTNALWASGAEAMSINGQRITSRTAIRFAGDAILVNFRPLNRPYTITAIGPPDGLQTDFAAGPGGAYLATLKNNFGVVVKESRANDATVPGATALTLREAQVPQTASTPTPAQASNSPEATP